MTTTATSMKLSDSKVKLRERFPGIRHAVEAEMVAAGDPGSPWSYATVEYLMLKVVRTVLRWLPSVDMHSEAAAVHLFSSALAEVTDALRPNGESGRFVCDSGPLSTDFVVEHQGQEWLAGFEQGVKAGTFRGGIELQYVQEVTTQGKRIYVGAVKVKRLKTGTLDESHVEEARKEAYALWCHNALLGSYRQVWVLLTNGEQVIRVTYDGDNTPLSRVAQLYYNRMPCFKIVGTLRVSRPYALWYIMLPNGFDCSSDTRKAFTLLLDTFCTSTPPTLEQLQDQEQKRDQDLKVAVGAFKDHFTLYAPADIRCKRLVFHDDEDPATKRSKTSQDA